MDGRTYTIYYVDGGWALIFSYSFFSSTNIVIVVKFWQHRSMLLSKSCCSFIHSFIYSNSFIQSVRDRQLCGQWAKLSKKEKKFHVATHNMMYQHTCCSRRISSFSACRTHELESHHCSFVRMCFITCFYLWGNLYAVYIQCDLTIPMCVMCVNECVLQILDRLQHPIANDLNYTIYLLSTKLACPFELE